MAREYVLKILNWAKYQTREVKTKSAWLRFQNDFIESPNFQEFNSDERIVWIHALCCASKLNSDVLRVPHQCSHRLLHRCTGIDENTFHRALKKLQQLKVIEIRTTRGRYADDTSENADDTLRDVTRRYEDETRRDETLRNETELKSIDPAPPRSTGSSVATWDEYRSAYLKRYGEPPVRNASVNGMLSKLVKRLGEAEAPLVAAFFVQHNAAFYVRSMHPVNLLLRDAEKLRTEWATGTKMLGATANEIERIQNNADNIREAAERHGWIERTNS